MYNYIYVYICIYTYIIICNYNIYIYIYVLYVQIASDPISKAPRNSHPVLALPSYLIGWIDLTSPVDVNNDWDIPRYWYTNCNHSLSNLYHYIENSLRDGQSGSIAGLTFEPQMIAEDFGVPKKTKIIQPLVSPVLVDVPLFHIGKTYCRSNHVKSSSANPAKNLAFPFPLIFPFALNTPPLAEYPPKTLPLPQVLRLRWKALVDIHAAGEEAEVGTDPYFKGRKLIPRDFTTILLGQARILERILTIGVYWIIRPQPGSVRSTCSLSLRKLISCSRSHAQHSFVMASQLHKAGVSTNAFLGTTSLS